MKENSKNRLAGEKSPYLLQHANNPVDWYPWGPEAMAAAKTENKPMFLSIGYSTCHWCHVMEHESFEDDQVAALMNKTFISIKVDREERPDIDNIYMTACQMMTGQGGWPLTIIMTPDLEPFFAATYIPKSAKFRRRGMVDLIPEIERRWTEDRESLVNTAGRVTSAMSQEAKGEPGNEPGEEALHLGFRQLATRYDHDNGGFGDGMKFPTPHQLLFLLRYWRRTGNAGALSMAEETLAAMRKGGIFDQLGYGFHRYSTEPTWLVPHFEKMLYDQALLMLAYSEAFQATGEEQHGKTVRQIWEYVRRDLTSPEGAFYSAQDADSEGVEGKYYVWTLDQIGATLDSDTADTFASQYGMSARGNFDEEGLDPGSNILSLGDNSTVPTTPEASAGLEAARAELLRIRSERVPPLLDDKVLTDWNGLMIGALARASVVLGDGEMAAAATRAADFVMKTLVDGEGRLLHRYRDGEAGLSAHLDDYAFMVFGLVELYQATFEERHLERALHLNGLMIDLFGPAVGGLFLTAHDSEKLIVRPRDFYDGAIPSGNSVAVWNLLRLSMMTGDETLEDRAAEISRGFSVDVGSAPSSFAMFLSAVDLAVGPGIELVIAGERDNTDTRAMLEVARKQYSPNLVVLLHPEKGAAIEKMAPFVASQPAMDDRATAYVCENRSCSFPTGDARKLATLLGERSRVNSSPDSGPEKPKGR